jgi:hypothetical protein
VEVSNLLLNGAATTTLSWDSQAAQVGTAVTYDVARGTIGAWPVGSGAEVCPGRALPATTMSDTTLPAARTGFWYLARGHNACGIGTYGFASNGVARTTLTCP